MSSWHRISTASQSSSTLNSDREQHTSEPTECGVFARNEVPKLPRSKEEIVRSSTSPKDHVAHKPLSPNDTTSGPATSIVVGFVACVAVAIGHHFFLTFLNGRNIDEYPQYWVKNANNAFAAIFSLCIAFVATCALIQMKWRVAKRKSLSIKSIDNLFALPSPSALFTTLTSTRLRSLGSFLLPILAATFIQSIALVSVFVPNALTVAPSAEISRDIKVPTLDLSTGPIKSMSTDHLMAYHSASQLWTTVLTSIMLQSPLLYWKIPPGCGATCKFDLVYDGSGLQCTDTPSESPPYTPPSDSSNFPLVYNATSTLYPNPRISSLSLWEIMDQYEFRIGYITTEENGPNTGHGGGSVHCVFRKATYKASFQVENNTMEVNHTLQSYGDILGTIKYGKSDTQCSVNLTGLCFTNGINTRAMCDVFASAFEGQIEFPNMTGGINVAVLDLLFSHDPYYMAFNFQLEGYNLSESLTSLFSNLTLGYIPHRNDTTTVRAELWDGSYAWSYTVWILWAVYLPTLLLAGLVILNGLLSIHSNKRGMDDKFSNFLLATRNTELDVVCMNIEDFAELQQLRLLYRGEGTFSVASGCEYPKHPNAC